MRNLLFTCVCILLLIAECNKEHIDTVIVPSPLSMEETISSDTYTLIPDSIIPSDPNSPQYVITYMHNDAYKIQVLSGPFIPTKVSYVPIWTLYPSPKG